MKIFYNLATTSVWSDVKLSRNIHTLYYAIICFVLLFPSPPPPRGLGMYGACHILPSWNLNVFELYKKNGTKDYSPIFIVTVNLISKFSVVEGHFGCIKLVSLQLWSVIVAFYSQNSQNALMLQLTKSEQSTQVNFYPKYFLECL